MKCTVCNREHDEKSFYRGYTLRPAIAQLIKEDFPDWNDNCIICKEDLKRYRIKYFTHLLKLGGGNVDVAQKNVINSIAENKVISQDINSGSLECLSFGERIADRVAEFGGSWGFIISFFSILLIWICINIFALTKSPFDPYPFILLNLILSCLAAIQAPIIMMSQNRQATKDRLQAENDYKVNLKSELEIKVMNEKLDHLMLDQWDLMMKSHKMQLEILNELKILIDDDKARETNDIELSK